MNAAARVVSDTWKYDLGLRQLRHSELTWLNMADRVTYMFCMKVQKCLHNQSPYYRAVYTGRPSRRTTAPSFGQPRLLVVPSIELDTYSSVVCSLWLVRPSGTQPVTTCVIQISASPALVAYWRRTCFTSIRRIEHIKRHRAIIRCIK